MSSRRWKKLCKLPLRRVMLRSTSGWRVGCCSRYRGPQAAAFKSRINVCQRSSRCDGQVSRSHCTLWKSSAPSSPTANSFKSQTWTASRKQLTDLPEFEAVARRLGASGGRGVCYIGGRALRFVLSVIEAAHLGARSCHHPEGLDWLS